MAVDSKLALLIALEAMEAASGGVTDAYTKSETDALLDGKADIVNGKVPSSQLPSYVDDVLEYSSTSAFPVEGESGKIYIVQDTNKTYRWGGSAYVEISESLALGETASTAYAGDKGKENADAISAIKDGLTIDSFADVESALDGKANTSSLAAVATSGSYNDLSNKPTIPAAQVNADWDAVSGVSQILNKPTIPAAQVSSDWNASSGVAQILNKPTLGAAASRGVDTTATDGSTNLITSGGVYTIVGDINTVLESVL